MSLEGDENSTSGGFTIGCGGFTVLVFTDCEVCGFRGFSSVAVAGLESGEAGRDFDDPSFWPTAGPGLGRKVLLITVAEY